MTTTTCSYVLEDVDPSIGIMDYEITYSTCTSTNGVASSTTTLEMGLQSLTLIVALAASIIAALLSALIVAKLWK
jgi:hypothetical protein